MVVDWEDPSLNTKQIEILNGRVLQGILFEKNLSHITFEFEGELFLRVFIDTPVDDCELIFLSEKESYFLNGNGDIGHEDYRVP